MRLMAFLIFIAVPLAELALLIKIGDMIGVLPTVALVIVTAVIGVSLLRIQGLTVLQNARVSIDAGRPPIESVVDGVLLLIAGAVLLTPGLITDAIGFLLLIPAIRRSIGEFAFAKLINVGSINVSGFPPQGDAGRHGTPGGNPKQPGRRDAGKTIEGEFSHVDDEPAEDKPNASRDEKNRDPKGSPWRQ